MKYDYDVAVIGAGPAGLVASKLAKGLGKKTVLIEKENIGGDCTWYGCVPSKTLIRSARAVHEARNLEKYGISADIRGMDTSKVMDHVRGIVKADAQSHTPDHIRAEGIDMLQGGAAFADPHTLLVNDGKITAKKFILCTGSRARIPDIPGIENTPYLTNRSLFQLEKLPESLIVAGSGPIGIETAAALSRLGVRVTVLSRRSGILPKEDPEMAETLRELLEKEGVHILTRSSFKHLYHENNTVSATIDRNGEEESIQAEALLIATGRQPDLEELKVENAGVEYDEKGVKVNRNLRTSASHIYAAGDIVPPYLFTHVAEYEAVIAATNACIGLPVKSADYGNVLWTTYTDPELARAGFTEAEARKDAKDGIRVYKWHFQDVDRAKTDMNTEGFAKIITTSNGKILGIHILGHCAAELMHELQAIKVLGKPFSCIAGIMHSYPSYSDVVRQPAKKCYIDLLNDRFLVRSFKSIKDKFTK
ncbi:MAG: FAD-dependent oxidoreductase [Desulfobacteraceae bacterium]